MPLDKKQPRSAAVQRAMDELKKGMPDVDITDVRLAEAEVRKEMQEMERIDKEWADREAKEALKDDIRARMGASRKASAVYDRLPKTRRG